jgi:hypothetical protein
MKIDYSDSDDTESIGHTFGFIGPMLLIFFAIALGLFSIGSLLF